VDWHTEGIRLQGESAKDDEDVFLPTSQFAPGYLRALAIEADHRHSLFLITYHKSSANVPQDRNGATTVLQ
jgi:hypothetical protein